MALHSFPTRRRLSCPHSVLRWGPWKADTLAFLELPEKQEQLAAIYAVLEHLPEANHNSLERLIFHLVKQVPAATLCGMRGPCRSPHCPHWDECSLLVLHQDVGPC